MTLPLERAGTRRPVTWLTIVGALLLPALIGGILVTALTHPSEHLDRMTAAIVNDDEPVTIDGQIVPLGRQLTAGLVEGSDDIPSNLDWTITDDDDAARGLADGTYAAVVTIPANFSSAATSTAPGGTPEQATIHVETAPDSLVVDDAISAQVTSAAASMTGTMLSETYLENVFLGFTTLGEQLGTAADGAAQVAGGVHRAAEGAGRLPAGAAELAGGAGTIATSTDALAGGLDRIAGGIGRSADGAGRLAGSLDQAAARVNDQDLVDAAATADAYAQTATGTATPAAQALGALAQSCAAETLNVDFCTRLGAVAQDVASAAESSAYAAGFTAPTSAGIAQLTAQTSAGLAEAATQTRGLQSGLNQLATASAQSAAGARDLSSGAAQLQAGAGELARGAQSVADGVSALATGSDELASGLATAVEEVPTYTDEEAQDLASVVADPVVAEGVGTAFFGASAVPLLASVALWFGGLGTYVALRAAPSRVLGSRRPSAVLALQGLWPAAAIGAAQGVLVAGVVQLAAGYDGAVWASFALVAVVAGIAFAAVNQALVTVFGGAGRWLSALIGVLAVATGVVSTVPEALTSVAALLPPSPAYSGMLSALTAAEGHGVAFVSLAIWSALAFLATTLAVARRRTISAKQLLAPTPA